ncbi:MAG: ComEC/Rec2 family competence protein [Acidimicrobiia bacterium]
MEHHEHVEPGDDHSAEALTIEMLPAKHGDCLLLSYPNDASRGRILVDVGPVTAWPDIEPILRRQLDGAATIELFVVTHVDTDHIEGALKLRQHGLGGVGFGDTWFNGYEHLAGDGVGDKRGGVQGEFLHALLQGSPRNLAFDGRSVGLWEDDELAFVETAEPDAGEIAFTILSPGRRQRRKMATAWERACKEANVPIGDTERVLQLLAEDQRYSVEDRGKETDVTYGKDSSAANGSSIAFLLERAGCRVLLTGDAHAEVLTASIKRLLQLRSEPQLRVDAWKLAHHGSRYNITPELLQLIECDTYLVSTNGDQFRHPDPGTIGLIAEHGASRGVKPTVLFNYRSATTEPFASDGRITARYGEAGYASLRLAARVPGT